MQPNMFVMFITAIMVIGVVIIVVALAISFNNSCNSKGTIEICPVPPPCPVIPVCNEIRPCVPCNDICETCPLPFKSIYNDQNSNFTWGSSTSLTNNGYLFVAQENVIDNGTTQVLQGTSKVFAYTWDGTQYILSTSFDIDGGAPRISASNDATNTYLSVLTTTTTNAITITTLNFFLKGSGTDWSIPTVQNFTGSVNNMDTEGKYTAIATQNLGYLLAYGTINKLYEGLGVQSVALTSNNSQLVLCLGTTGTVMIYYDPLSTNLPVKTLYGNTTTFGERIWSSFPLLVVDSREIYQVALFNYNNLDYSLGCLPYPLNEFGVQTLNGVAISQNIVNLYNTYISQAFENSKCGYKSSFNWFLPNSVWSYVSSNQTSFCITNYDNIKSQLTVQARCVC